MNIYRLKIWRTMLGGTHSPDQIVQFRALARHLNIDLQEATHNITISEQTPLKLQYKDRYFFVASTQTLINTYIERTDITEKPKGYGKAWFVHLYGDEQTHTKELLVGANYHCIETTYNLPEWW